MTKNSLHSIFDTAPYNPVRLMVPKIRYLLHFSKNYLKSTALNFSFTTNILKNYCICVFSTTI